MRPKVSCVFLQFRIYITMSKAHIFPSSVLNKHFFDYNMKQVPGGDTCTAHC